jgi:hypothetical protein
MFNKKGVIMKKEKFKKLVAKLYANPELKERFIKNPKEVLRDEGITVADDVDLQIVQDSDTVKHFVLPNVKPGETLDLEEIEQRVSKFL